MQAMSTKKTKRGIIPPSETASEEVKAAEGQSLTSGIDGKGEKTETVVKPLKQVQQAKGISEGKGAVGNSVPSSRKVEEAEAKAEDEGNMEVALAEVDKSVRNGKRKRANELAEQKREVKASQISKSFQNKEKVLVLSSRGIVHRFRHLMVDLMTLLPHSKKDVKLDTKDTLGAVNEVADLKGCSSSIFFECRKKKDCYMWIAKTPAGPSAKFLVNAVHTMAELKLTGNHLKGSRPLLTFSPNFDSSPHLQLLKELFTQVFSTPKDHRKVKPFFDHVFSFSLLDNHIWFRNYQITVPSGITGKLEKGALEKMSLVEVGPRFCMNPIKIFSGSFTGVTLYQNPFYVSPNVLRANEKRARSGKYAQKVKAKQRRKQHLVRNPHVQDELEDWRS